MPQTPQHDRRITLAAASDVPVILPNSKLSVLDCNTLASQCASSQQAALPLMNIALLLDPRSNEERWVSPVNPLGTTWKSWRNVGSLRRHLSVTGEGAAERSRLKRHKRCVTMWKGVLASIKFGRAEEVEQKKNKHVKAWHDEGDEAKHVAFQDFNMPIEALQSSIRLREILKSGKIVDASGSGEAKERAHTMDSSLEELVAAFESVDPFVVKTGEDDGEEVVENDLQQKKPQQTSFNALLGTIDFSAAGNLVNVATQSEATPPNIWRYRRSLPADTHMRQIKPEAPTSVHDYIEGISNVYYHPGMTLSQASEQLLLTLKGAQGAVRAWLTWSPTDFLAFAKEEPHVKLLCRDLHWIADFLAIGRSSWDLAEWDDKACAEMKEVCTSVREGIGALAKVRGPRNTVFEGRNCLKIGEALAHVEAIAVELGAIGRKKDKDMGAQVGCLSSEVSFY